MARIYTGITHTLLYSLLAVALLAPPLGWSQTADPLQQVDKRLTERREAAEEHRKQMETIKDPEQLTTAMRQHFQMTEEILALMLERQKLLAAQAPTSGTPAGQSGGMQGGSMQGGGMQGGRMEHGMGMMRKGMGGTQGGGMPGGMMQKELGGMPGSGTPGGGMQGGMQGGGTMQKEMGSMSGSGMAGQPASGSPSGPATPSNDMAQMMQRITEHSAYMETLKDQATLTQEMLRHQKMLDQMLQLMQ